MQSGCILNILSILVHLSCFFFFFLMKNELNFHLKHLKKMKEKEIIKNASVYFCTLRAAVRGIMHFFSDIFS